MNLETLHSIAFLSLSLSNMNKYTKQNNPIYSVLSD